MKDEKTTTVGLIGLFDEPEALLLAAAKVREAGFVRWDCHTPHPVHGLARAMGLPRSRIGRVTVGFAFLGLATAIALTGGLSAIHYPIRVGGKPMFSWQAFMPIFFELFVLFGAVATVAAVIVCCRLGRWHSPLHDSAVMREVTGSRFAVVLFADDRNYAEAKARALLADAGCADIRPLVELAEEESKLAP